MCQPATTGSHKPVTHFFTGDTQIRLTKIAITLELYTKACWNFTGKLSSSKCESHERMKTLAILISSYLPIINEINGQITQKLMKQEFLFLPMPHILISWAQLWSFINLSCSVQVLWHFSLTDLILSTIGWSDNRSWLTPNNSITLEPYQIA